MYIGCMNYKCFSIHVGCIVHVRYECNVVILCITKTHGLPCRITTKKATVMQVAYLINRKS